MKLHASIRNRRYFAELRPKPGHENERFELKLSVDGHLDRAVDVRVISRTKNHWTLEVNGQIEDLLVYPRAGRLVVDRRSVIEEVELSHALSYVLRSKADEESFGAIRLTAQMPGRIVSVRVAEGTIVAKGEGLLIIEAMKMQNELRAPRAGRVTRCAVVEGQSVEGGALLIEID